MHHWIKDVIDLVIPHTCVSCDSNIIEPAPGLCGRCIHKIQALPRSCDHELTLRLRKHTNQVDSSMALMYFEQHGVSQHLLHKIKYKHGEHLARYWGRYQQNHGQTRHFRCSSQYPCINEENVGADTMPHSILRMAYKKRSAPTQKFHLLH